MGSFEPCVGSLQTSLPNQDIDEQVQVDEIDKAEGNLTRFTQLFSNRRLIIQSTLQIDLEIYIPMKAEQYKLLLY